MRQSFGNFNIGSMGMKEEVEYYPSYTGKEPLKVVRMRKLDGYERERRPYSGQPKKGRKSTKLPETSASDPLSIPSILKFQFPEGQRRRQRDSMGESNVCVESEIEK